MDPDARRVGPRGIFMPCDVSTSLLFKSGKGELLGAHCSDSSHFRTAVDVPVVIEINVTWEGASLVADGVFADV